MTRRILLAIAGLLLLGQAALAQTPNPTQTIFFFTNNAKSFFSGNTTLMQKFANDQVNILNSASAQSGPMTTSYATPIVSTSFCCGTQPYMNTDPVNGGMLGEVMGSAKLMSERDSSHADVVVVVSNNGSGVDVAGRTMMDCKKTGAEAAEKAIVGINMGQSSQGYSLLGDYMGALQCATPETAPSGTAKAYTWMTGTDSTHCDVFTTIESATTSSTVVTATLWFINNQGGGITGYSRTDFDGANADMTSKCPLLNAGVYTYTCAPTGSCTTSGGGSLGSCPYSANKLDTRGAPICGVTGTPSCTTTTPSTGTGSKTTFSCTGGTFWKLNAYSNTAHTYLGQPMGDSLHNSATATDARNLAETSRYRRFSIATLLKEATIGR